jgi:hypothetical protein
MSTAQNQALGAYAHGAKVTASPTHGGLIPPHGGVAVPKHGETYIVQDLGPELVTNGTFGTDTSGWTPGAATLAVVGGQLEVTATGAGATASQIIFGMEIGATYRISATISPSNTADKCRLSTQFGIGGGVRDFATYGSTVTMDIVCSGVNGQVSCDVANAGAFGAVGDKALFDNVSVRKVL